jgi:hypothetical protein
MFIEHQFINGIIWIIKQLPVIENKFFFNFVPNNHIDQFCYDEFWLKWMNLDDPKLFFITKFDFTVKSVYNEQRWDMKKAYWQSGSDKC